MDRSRSTLTTADEGKAAWRARLRARVAAMSPAERERESAAICERVRGLAAFGDAAVVLLYRPLPTEVDVTQLWDVCRDARKAIFAPRVDPSIGGLRFVDVGHDTVWRRCENGVWEPSAGIELTAEAASQAVIVVPGLGFSRLCDRLGRGGGFYDHALTNAPIGRCGYRVGVGFDAQIVEQLPSDAGDVPMHVVVSASNVWSHPLPLDDLA